MRFDPGIVAGDDAEAVDDEDIRTQVGDAVGNVEIHAGDKAHHCDQSGDGQNYAEEGKKAAQLVRLQGIER